MAALVISKSERNIIHRHYKYTLEKLQRLHSGTPEVVVFFLGGSLPIGGILDMRQLSLFGMICQLEDSNLLYKVAHSTLSRPTVPTKSWFMQIQRLCTQYNLPDPLTLLLNPPSKPVFKKLIKSRIYSFWEEKLRGQVPELSSLTFFLPQFYSLAKPHPIWSTAGNNPYEVQKATCQAQMLSGRYRTCWLSRHWSSDKSGFCSLPSCCSDHGTPGTLSHILLDCVDLAPARSRCFKLWNDYLIDKPYLFNVVKHYTIGSSIQSQTQFLLDCSVLPDVIELKQKFGLIALEQLFYLTRTLCFSVHKMRCKLLGTWITEK